jgi:chromate transporter
MSRLALYFLRLGALGFGGPIALAANMQKDLVEERRWVAPQDYKEGLAFSQLSPGPLAAQLAMYLGWVRGGPIGATMSAAAFILPSFLMVVALAALYVHFGRLGWIQSVFYGIGPAVISIIAMSAYKLVRRTLVKDPLLWGIFALLGATTAWTEREMVWLILLCGAAAVAVKTPLRSFARGLPVAFPLGLRELLLGSHGIASAATLGTLSFFFLKAGAFVFGSGLAIVPFLYGGVVDQYHWLDERQFLDAVAVAMITPGPVVITAGFVGYLVAGAAGAMAASFAVFAPPFFIVILGAPCYRRLANNPQVKAFVEGVTAGAVGAIAGAAIVLGRRAIVDWPTGMIAAASLAVLLASRKIPEPFVILAAGGVGLLLAGPH